MPPFRANQHAGPAGASASVRRPTGESVNYLCCYGGACSICGCIHGVSGAVCAHKPVTLDQLWPLGFRVGRAMWNRLAGWRLLHTTDTLDRFSASLGFLHFPNREVSIGNVQARYARNRRRLVPTTDTLDLWQYDHTGRAAVQRGQPGCGHGSGDAAAAARPCELALEAPLQLRGPASWPWRRQPRREALRAGSGSAAAAAWPCELALEAPAEPRCPANCRCEFLRVRGRS